MFMVMSRNAKKNAGGPYGEEFTVEVYTPCPEDARGHIEQYVAADAIFGMHREYLIVCIHGRVK